MISQVLISLNHLFRYLILGFLIIFSAYNLLGSTSRGGLPDHVTIEEDESTVKVFAGAKIGLIDLDEWLLSVHKDVIIDGHALGMAVTTVVLDRAIKFDHSITIHANTITIIEESLNSSFPIILEAYNFDGQAGEILVQSKITAPSIELYAETRLIVSENLYSSGGKIALLGEGDVIIKNGVIIDSSSPNTGGEILIGGDYQGTGAHQAKNVLIEEGVKVFSNATENGDGGKVMSGPMNKQKFMGQLQQKVQE